MDSAMRDLERIRERQEREGRPLAMIGVLIGVTIALVLAMGLLVGGWDDPAQIAADDPLAHLDALAGLEVPPTEAQEAAATPDIDPSALTFPRVLAPAAPDERPEVAAALVAAAAELAHPDPIDRRIDQGLPAAVSVTSESDAIARVVPHDPLIADALPEEHQGALAPAGRDGEFTAQVISYDSPEGAEAFARTLRARGHRAFVMSAPVEGRGTMYRVRIGPFETMAEAQEFRREFERTERMNTLLVHRREDTP